MELNQAQRYAADIHHAITRLFDQESEEYKYEPQSVDGTSFFTGVIMSFNLLFNEFTQNDDDLLDSVSVANRLVFQYLKDNGTVE